MDNNNRTLAMSAIATSVYEDGLVNIQTKI